MNTLYPAFALIGWTILCMIRLGAMRGVAVKKGEVDPRFFSLYRGYEEPEKLAAYSRHVTNLFETPVLFYAICITAYATGHGTTTWAAGLAWAYFAVRLLHSYVHLTSNVVLTRFRIFIVSMVLLTTLWAVVLTQIMRM